MRIWFFTIILLSTFTSDALAGFSVIYIIGGDSSLRYYVNGRAYDGGNNAQAAAERLAASCRDCEVSIFRYRARGNDLARLYRNGRLVRRDNFQRRRRSYNMEQESRWLQRYTDGEARPKSVLYFGHWLPNREMPYFTSTGATYSLQAFTDGINRFLKPQEKFQLVVLSTCNNGSPLAVDVLRNKAHMLVASPSKLHLSMLNTESIRLLGGGWSPQSVAQKIVDDSFTRLTTIDRTEVSVAAYDLDTPIPQLDEVVSSLLAKSRDDGIVFEDCARLGHHLPTPYLRFLGHRILSKRNTHSGWECLI